jgi:hypothetical protein
MVALRGMICSFDQDCRQIVKPRINSVKAGNEPRGPRKAALRLAPANIAWTSGNTVTGVAAPTWPASLGTMSTPFSSGVVVQSCPAGVTFSVTTG